MVSKRMIAAYGRDRILVADLCSDNPDQWHVGSLLNVADMLSFLLAEFGTTAGRVRKVRACNENYCIEIEANEGGFLAWEVSIE